LAEIMSFTLKRRYLAVTKRKYFQAFYLSYSKIDFKN
jgi:hypothetical protein